MGLASCVAPAWCVPDHAARGDAIAGGTMRIARPAASAAETLDPASALSAYEYLGALYNRVVRLDRNGETVPDLATEWSTNADATVWTFKLRPGVRFHDGQPLTSRDVRYSYEIGRASCRERVNSGVGGGALQERSGEQERVQ